ncbi:hypothetical protein NPIL_337191, partial [Nephila pilipes]
HASLRYLGVSKIEENVERILFLENRKDNAECDGGEEHHSKRSFQEVVLAMEKLVS